MNVTVAPADTGKPPKIRYGGVMTSVVSVTLMYNVCLGGALGILIPKQIAEITPDGKVGALAMVTAVGAAVTVFANPIAGALSDRTRSRWGRRTPWVIAGGLGSAVSLLALGTLGALVWIALFWALTKMFLNVLIAPVNALVPDRTPPEKRGFVSALMGLAGFAGAVGGTLVAAAFVSRIPAGYTVIAVGLVAAAVSFALLSGDRSSAGEPRSPFHLGRFLRGFWVSPRRYPDFAWAFVARTAMVLGFNAILTYQLYILQDYVGMSLDEAAELSPALNLVLVVGVIIGTIPSGALSDRLGRRKVFVLISSLTIATAGLAPLFWPTVTAMYVFYAIAGLGFGCYAAVDQALMTLVLPNAEDNGKDMGLLSIANNGAQAVAPVVAAGLISALGGYRSLFGAGVVLAIIGAAAVLPIKSVR
ncbi:MFS transporter [Streptomyces sp. NEAU-Y11]|uniref:MFS transporter n=1 Tax=Streptomyces cucumeris TaxID=2962890 RepID=UPI0020C923AA|nr:MFS transporter [Streptomyces sp. NEAU-Y11]MCP9211793.1 MFS transporter [Streptomyces sp. NEAU-Y11]